MSWKPEVQANGDKTWTGNQLRFATKAEAQAQVIDLMWRWTAVDDTRVVETDDPVTAYWDAKNSKIVHVLAEA